MGVIANVEEIVIVNRSLDWTSYTDCSVTFVGLCGITIYHVSEELFVAYYRSLVDKFTCTFLIIVISEENAQQPCPFLHTFRFTKMYARRGMINAY